jgi:APA family basic amino acid/polyamine antiporter
LQTGITLLLVVTSTFERVLVYTECVMLASSALTVAGVFVSRSRHRDLPRPFRVPGYPWTPLVFLAVSLYMLIFLAANRPRESLMGLATLVAGVLLYWAAVRPRRQEG